MAGLTGLATVVLGSAVSGNPPTYGSPEGIRQAVISDKTKSMNVTFTFGDAASTYPSGGIPLSLPAIAALTVPGSSTTISAAVAAAKSFGLQNEIQELLIMDSSNSTGYVYKIDKTNLKLRIYQSAGVPAHNHPLSLKNAAVADGATTRVNAGTNLLGANTGSDITVAGGGANGGVQNNTAGADVGLNEVSTSFVPASGVSLSGLVKGR